MKRLEKSDVSPSEKRYGYLCNALRAIIAGWVFQLNGDVTGKFCNKSVDLVEFSVTSIPKQNNILCLGVIPKGSESEKNYKITRDDFRTVVVLITV